MTKAAEFRIHLDLLLSEHVMMIAKTSAGAFNHTDEYTAYATLLNANFGDLEVLFSQAFGNTAAEQIMRAWNAENVSLVDYAIGVVVHDDDRAKRDMLKLDNEIAPQLAGLLNEAGDVPGDRVRQILADQATADRMFIDDLFAQHFDAFYRDLHGAYAKSSALGDLVATQVARKFPDKFPGDPASHDAGVRLSAAQLLQERSYLVTMSTAAVVAGRGAEVTPSSTALTSSCAALTEIYPKSLNALCSLEVSAMTNYAKGDATAREVILGQYVSQFASLANVGSPSVVVHMSALLHAVDDQRASDFMALATDDRAAATSTQPIADSVVVEG